MQENDTTATHDIYRQKVQSNVQKDIHAEKSDKNFQ